LTGHTLDSFATLMENVDRTAFQDSLLFWQLVNRPPTPVQSRQGHIYINADFPEVTPTNPDLNSSSLRMRSERFGFSTIRYIHDYSTNEAA
jgi:hypothetical protein